MSAKPIKEHITWKQLSDDGEEVSFDADVFIKKFSYADQYRIYSVQAIEGEAASEHLLRVDASIIAAAVRFGKEDQDGNIIPGEYESLSTEDAYQLHPALKAALNEVNTKHNYRAKKISPPPKSSGVN